MTLPQINSMNVWTLSILRLSEMTTDTEKDSL